MGRSSYYGKGEASGFYFSRIIDVLRVIVAVAFIFSGFTKAVDPWGTAIKLGEYFSAFSAEWLSGSEMFFSILQSSAEMLLGFAMLFGIGHRVTYTIMVLAMLFFTGLTLVLALTNPISDCGCFGDAVKLTNWQTFWKNVALLVMSLIVWWSNRSRIPSYKVNRKLDVGFLLLFTLFGAGISLYALMYLPPMDFLPFKEGTNIERAMQPGGVNRTEVVLVYKDIGTGRQHEFALGDTTWQDETRWEFVETRVDTYGDAKPALITDFAIFNSDGDHTSELLNPQRLSIDGEVLNRSAGTFMVTMTTFDDMGPACRAKVERALDYASQYGIEAIGVTTSPLPADNATSIGRHTLAMYNIDGTTLKSLIRARAGLVVLENGTIRAKWSCRGIPDMQKRYPGGILMHELAAVPHQMNKDILIGILIGGVAIAYVVYRILKRRR